MHSELGWTTKKFETIGSLSQYIISYTQVHVLPQSMYDVAKDGGQKNLTFYFAEFLTRVDKVGRRVPRYLEVSSALIHKLQNIPTGLSFEAYFKLFDQFGTDYTMWVFEVGT